MKQFTDADVKNADTAFPRIYADEKELVKDPVARPANFDGYGAKLPTAHKINFNGKLYRLYATCYSNAASVWFAVKGRKIYVS